jgi:hypothetical protein
VYTLEGTKKQGFEEAQQKAEIMLPRRCAPPFLHLSGWFFEHPAIPRHAVGGHGIRPSPQ